MFEIFYAKLEKPLDVALSSPMFEKQSEAEDYAARSTQVNANYVFAVVDTQLVEPEFVYLNGVKYERVKEI